MQSHLSVKVCESREDDFATNQRSPGRIGQKVRVGVVRVMKDRGGQDGAAVTHRSKDSFEWASPSARASVAVKGSLQGLSRAAAKDRDAKLRDVGDGKGGIALVEILELITNFGGRRGNNLSPEGSTVSLAFRYRDRFLTRRKIGFGLLSVLVGLGLAFLLLLALAGNIVFGRRVVIARGAVRALRLAHASSRWQPGGNRVPLAALMVVLPDRPVQVDRKAGSTPFRADPVRAATGLTKATARDRPFPGRVVRRAVDVVVLERKGSSLGVEVFDGAEARGFVIEYDRPRRGRAETGRGCGKTAVSLSGTTRTAGLGKVLTNRCRADAWPAQRSGTGPSRPQSSAPASACASDPTCCSSS